MSKDIGRPGGLSSDDGAASVSTLRASIPDAALITATIGVTGTRKAWTAPQCNATFDVLARLMGAGFRWMRNGDCIGSDERMGDWWRDAGGKLILHPPENPGLRAHLAAELRYPSKPYLARNLDIAKACAALVATPAENIEQQRSGTWATIRHARKLKRPLCIIWPSGGVTRENWVEPASTLALRAALTGLLEKYTALVNCGDCGFWNPEDEFEVIAARAALAQAIEARSGETAGLDPKDESAVAKPCAQGSSEAAALAREQGQ